MQTVSDDAGTAKNGTAFDKCTQGCLPVLVGGRGAWKPCLVPPFLVERHLWWMKILKFADFYLKKKINLSTFNFSIFFFLFFHQLFYNHSGGGGNFEARRPTNNVLKGDHRNVSGSSNTRGGGSGGRVAQPAPVPDQQRSAFTWRLRRSLS